MSRKKKRKTDSALPADSSIGTPADVPAKIRVDICIAGGGAAGMAAAVAAAERLRDGRSGNGRLEGSGFGRDRSVGAGSGNSKPCRGNNGTSRPGSGQPPRILIVEKMDRLGRKLKATGNGRCNLTNINAEGCREVQAFFGHLGVVTRVEDGGRVYPYSGDAADVVGALIDRIALLDVQVLTNTEVRNVQYTDPAAGHSRAKVNFQLRCVCGTQDVTIEADQLLIAMGGKAAPQFGTCGDGTKMARSLGLEVTRLAPALTGIETVEDVESMAGVRVWANTALYYNKKKIAEEAGEVQFNDYGISGICVMNLSSRIELADGASVQDGFRDYRIELDLLPELEGAADAAEAAGLIRHQMETQGVREVTSQALRSILRKPLAEAVAEASGGDPEQAGRLLKRYPLHVKNLRGWKYAQVTKGGVKLEELDPQRMEAKRVPGLYLAGEVLDYDGPCGGWNLQNAWVTGIRAGQAMAERLIEDQAMASQTIARNSGETEANSGRAEVISGGTEIR